MTLCGIDCNGEESDASSDVLSICFDAQVDNGLFSVMPDDINLEFTSIDSNTRDTFEDFSLTLPVVADNTFYIDCVVELTISNRVFTTTEKDHVIITNK